MAKERKIKDRFEVPSSAYAKDKALNAVVEAWITAAAEFVAARNESEEAKLAMQKVLGPKLKSEGISEGVRWDVKKNPDGTGGLIVEILEGEKPKRRRSKAEVRKVSFQ